MSYDAEGAILYSLTAKGTKILAEFTNPVVEYGNFPRVALKILEKLSSQNHKMTYSYDNYLFHFQVHDEIVFMCMADATFSKNQAYKFLEQVRDEWFQQFKDEGKNVKTAYAMNKQFKPVLKTKMNYFNTDPEANKVKKIRGQIEEIKEEMVKNIDKVIARGEKIDMLVGKTGKLEESAMKFEKGAKKLKASVMANNIKIIIVIIVFLVLAAIAIFLFLCRGIACLMSSSSSSNQ